MHRSEWFRHFAGSTGEHPHKCRDPDFEPKWHCKVGPQTAEWQQLGHLFKTKFIFKKKNIKKFKNNVPALTASLKLFRPQ